MNQPTRNLVIGAVLVVLGLATGQVARTHTPPQTASIVTPIAADGTATVTKVVDGDTIDVNGGIRVRYLGMDTPETVDPRKPVMCYGHEASNANRALVEGKTVRLVADVENTDKYGRLLRYVYLADGTLVNLALVTQGDARAYTWPPNIAHTKEIVAAEASARAAHLGVWACPHPFTK